MKFLLTNDDGYKCVGLHALYKELESDYLVKAISTEKGKSWIGKAIVPKATKLQKKNVEGREIFIAGGSPADCAQIGIHNLGDKPDLVVSGINIGENVGLGWILSSGTVGAAIEAALQGVPAIAVSYQFPLEDRVDFDDIENIKLYETAAIIAKKVIDKLVKGEFFNKADLFLINIPYKAKEDVGIEVVNVSRQSYGQLFYQSSEELLFDVKLPDYSKKDQGTDLSAIGDGKVSVATIKLELSSHGELVEELKKKFE